MLDLDKNKHDRCYDINCNYDDNLDKIIIIDYFKNNCNPCDNLHKLLTKQEKLYDNYIFYRCNVNNVKKLNIMQLPTLYIIKNGIILDKCVGYNPNIIINLLNKYV